MPKHDSKTIVLCSDGTGNIDIKGRGTNVFKLYEAVDIQGHKCDSKLRRQIAFYDDGVGTSSNPVEKILGEAFGLGFSANVRRLYIQLVRAYQSKNDGIFLFGFSRGAYTVRALSGMIQSLGILDSSQFLNIKELENAVNRCWKEFYDHAFRDKDLNKAALNDLSFFDNIEIKFIGVWDTVGAVGSPFEEFTKALNWMFPRRFVSMKPGRVIRACQALSIDDERMTFRPELWDEAASKPGQIEQVWFAGVHSNVGGGYPKHGMSLVALDWMMDKANKSGLRFIEAAREYARTEQDAHGTLYNSRAGFGVYYRWQPRDILRLCQERHITTPKVHVSVYERIAQCTEDYAPGNIPFCSEVVSHDNCLMNPHSWPGSQTLLDVQSLVDSAGTAFPGQHSLMDGVASTICRGKASYYSFLAVTILALTGLCLWPPRFWLILLGVLLLGGANWKWASKIDKALELVYSEFWSGRTIKNSPSLRKNLRALGL